LRVFLTYVWLAGIWLAGDGGSSPARYRNKRPAHEHSACLSRNQGSNSPLALNDPHRTIRAVKRLTHTAKRTDLPDFFHAAAACQALMHQTADHAEVLAAFMERHKPGFTGK